MSSSTSSSKSQLSQVPARKRRQAAATLALFATLFLAIAAVAATGATTAVIKAFVVVAVIAALVLGLMSWGVVTSIRNDEASAIDASLDAAIEQAVAARGETMCGCGHDHDPTEMHVPDDPCARDGHGAGCTHSCETCVLATLKRTSERSGTRPSPGPRRPSPVRR